eukprot:TRINITY_DN6032_c0_g1_i3.p1 TRINITY_DN6032_c0_g1~~TRINITY_DN6032_c0_g1_i3.p1  ORF type:complete len:108 (-),score=13.04 TRINITY_DN6032_c0_g1_i3:186-509(-)
MDDAPDPRSSPEGMLRVSRRMYLAGFFFLPWVWLIHYFYLKDHLKSPRTPPEVKIYVRNSLIGFFVTTAIFAIWLSVYITNWESWGLLGERLAISIPHDTTRVASMS